MNRREAIYLAHRRQRWLRPDWRSRKYWARPPAEVAEADGAWSGKGAGAGGALAQDSGPSIEELRRAQASLAHLRWLVADLKFDLTQRRLARKYSPDQPRVLRGDPDGGQWTDAGGGSSGSSRWTEVDKPIRQQFTTGQSADQSPRTRVVGTVIRVCVAGSYSLTTIDGIKSYQVTYECIGGRTFVKSGFGHDFKRIVLDPFQR